MLAVTHLFLLRWSYLVQILAVAAQKSSELWLRAHISSRQWGQLCIWGRKWLLKCRFRDYGAIQVSAGYGETKQLPTPTSRCLRATTHMHQQRGGCSLCGAWSFFFFPPPSSQEDTLLDSQFKELLFCCYDHYFCRKERQTADRRGDNSSPSLTCCVDL